MMYEIQSKSDFQAGTTLSVRIPEREVDKKALYTIASDPPDFLLPFRYRIIDGQMEFTYQIGNRSKLAYLSGDRSPSEYADLWSRLLQPLLDCEDWFMKPFSFVLKPEYFYCDKSGKTICFIYIPSINDCSDYNMLKNMVSNVAKQNHVTDINLENKVIWAIQDFNHHEFLDIFKPYKTNNIQVNVPTSHYTTTPEPPHEPLQSVEPSISINPIKKHADENVIDLKPESDDIEISFPNKGKTHKKEKDKKSQKETKEKRSPWGKKKTLPKEILQGAAKMQQKIMPEQPVTPPVYTPPTDPNDDVTQLDVQETDVPKFRYVGVNNHVKAIEIIIVEDEVFTIGRFDSSVGFKQSNFEFDRKTKAVSRRHAAVERSADGYILTDLDSAAGTFINGQKMIPNVPFKLERGYRVSFGHSGADYIWEE